MNSITEIQYKGKFTWVSESGKETTWDTLSKKYKPGRIQPNYVAPTVVKDTWNGKESDIQHISWTSYFFEMFIKESEIEFLRQLKSSDTVNIIQYSDDSGTVINKSFENIDLTTSDFLDISDPERAADTSGWKVSVIFRTERTVLSKALPVLNTNNISFQNSETWQFESGSPFQMTLNTKIDALDSFSIAHINWTSNPQYLTKYENIDGAWVIIGNTLTEDFGGVGVYRDVAALDANNVAILISADVAKYTFDGTDWSLVGNRTPLPAASFPFGRITALSESRIAAIDTEGELIVMDFDGTDWSQVGSTFNIPAGGSGSRDISTLASSKIAYIDDISSVLRSYDFTGFTWTLDENLSISTNGEVSIGSLSSTRVITNVRDGGFTFNGVRSYELTGSGWVEEPGFLSISVTTLYPDITGLDYFNAFATAANDTGIYNHDASAYYTDFDVIDWVKLTEDIFSNWKGNNSEVVQSISKTGVQIPIYLNTSDADQFIEDFKGSKKTTINGVIVDEIENESSEVAEDLTKIIARGVLSKVITNKGGSTEDLFPVVMNGNTYYTDFEIEVNEKEVDGVLIDWFDGSQKLAQSTYKKTSALLFFFTGASLDNFQEDFRVSQIKTLNGSPTQEAEITTELTGEDYYRVVITGVVSTTRVNHDMSPNNDYSLTVNGNVYDTDYVPKLISEQGEIDTFENQTGVNSTSKAISKTVRQLRFFLDEADSDQLRQDFELDGQNAVINPGAINVLENRTPEVNELGTSSDLYEVVVNCLTAATIN
jgi:hypothetical protein